jgi:hypothetical protein
VAANLRLAACWSASRLSPSGLGEGWNLALAPGVAGGRAAGLQRSRLLAIDHLGGGAGRSRSTGAPWLAFMLIFRSRLFSWNVCFQIAVVRVCLFLCVLTADCSKCP